MTDIEAKALAFLNDVCAEMGLDKVSSLELDIPGERALLRAIEQHEAFKREVSDAVEKTANAVYSDSSLIVSSQMKRFIIAKPDEATAGLALAVEETLELVIGDEDARRLRAAIEARGGRIVWEGDND